MAVYGGKLWSYVQKSTKMFGGFEKNHYLCRMNTTIKIITAKNSLTGEREIIAGPMGDETARQALTAETKRRRKARKKCAWIHLKIEDYYPKLI